MPSRSDIDTFVSAAAVLLELQLSADSHAAVAANVSILLDRSRDFEALTLADDLDPAGLLRL